MNQNFLVALVASSALSCENQGEVEVLKPTTNPELSHVYELSRKQRDLIQSYLQFYSTSESTVSTDELLSGAGIGFVSQTDSEAFSSRLVDGGLFVEGDQSAHKKVKLFLEEYLDQRYIDEQFRKSEQSRIEWGEL